MLLMISGAGPTLAEYARTPASRWLGAMRTPSNWNSLERILELGLPWCVDNACFDATKFSQKRYLRLLEKCLEAPTAPKFVTLPDQVGDHESTLFLFERWFRYLQPGRWAERLPFAFVCQNGLDDVGEVPWEFISAVFVGGDDEFKTGDFVAMELIPAAKEMGKWVHVGRVNTRNRLRWCVSAEVDSADGSSLSRFPRVQIPKFARWLEELTQEDERLALLDWRLRQELRELDHQPLVEEAA
jgi:hypothetical protein